MVQNDNRRKQTDLTPKLRFREFKELWTLNKIGDVLTLVTRPIKMKGEEEYSLITVKRRYGGIVHRGDYKGKEVKVKSQFLLEENDFLISKRQISHNACGLVPKNLVGSIVSNEYSVFLPKENLDIDYFDYFSQLPKVSQTFFLSSTGVHIEKMIFKVDTWFKWEFSFPSINEQQKIASFLSAVDEKIQQLSKKKELLEQYKKGVMQQLFLQKLRFKPGTSTPLSAGNGNAYPDWEEKNLGESCIVKTGNKDTQDRIEDGLYPFIVRSNKVESINSYSFDGEAILTSGDGVGVGKNFHYIIGKFDYHQRVYAMHSFKEGFFGKFIYYVFVKEFYKRVMRLSAKNSVDSVRMSMITEMKINFPVLEEQQKIASYLSSIDTKIESINNQISQTQSFKKGLLQQMFV